MSGIETSFSLIKDDGAHALMAQLTSLDFKEAKIREEAAKILAKMTVFPQLTRLGLGGNNIGASGAAALAASRAFPQLTSLSLRGNNIGPAGVIALAGSTTLTRLTRLGLGGNNIGSDGAKSLAASRAFPQLTSLNLDDNYISLQGIEALSVTKTLTQLTSLSLGGNNIGVEKVKALASITTLAQLTSLNLENNKIGVKGAIALAVSTTLTRLTSLSLWGNRIENEGVMALAVSRAFPQLRSLNLGGNEIWDEGVRALAVSTTLSELTCLYLKYNIIGNEGAAALAASMTLTQLLILGLEGNKIGDTGAAALAVSRAFPQLTTLDLSNNGIGDAGKKALQDAHPTWVWYGYRFFDPAASEDDSTPRLKGIFETLAGRTWTLMSSISVSGAGAAAASSAAVFVPTPRSDFVPSPDDTPPGVPVSKTFWEDTSLSLVVLTHQAWPAVDYLQQKTEKDLRLVIDEIGVTGSSSFMGLAWALPHWALSQEEQGAWALEDLLEQWGPSTAISRSDLIRTFRKGGGWSDPRLDDRDIHPITVGIAPETTYTRLSSCTVQKACEEALGSKPYDVSLEIVKKQASLLPETVTPLLIVLGSIEKTEAQEEGLRAFYKEDTWAYQRVEVSTVASSTGAAAAAASGAGERLVVEEEPSVHLSSETKDHLDHIYEHLLKPLVKARFPEEEEL